ncbi:MAG TPA: hypothetical protein VIG33_16140 [Pseudobdellovibrionaceae bacterium]|jgi:hypothetical protein
MTRVGFILFFVLVAGCGTTSKKLMALPPLAETAPVQVFYSQPNLKYDKVCEIEAVGNNSIGGSYTQKEDFEVMFKKEARKCGADGVIFGFMHGYQQGKVTAYGTGIKISGQGAGLSGENKIKAFSLAIQSHDLAKVKELLGAVPKEQSERAPTDDELVNLGLYIATLDGLTCDEKIVSLLEDEYGATVPMFNAINFYSTDKNDSNTPLCRDVMARSFPKMKDRSKAIVEINNHYVALLNSSYDTKLNGKAAKFSKLLNVAARAISDSCKTSSTDPACATKGAYLDFANKSKNAGVASIKKNAKDVLAILK